MGIIIRNGIEYGGKTFEDMTYEEYQALPEVVKNDGAIRHIIDRDINHAFIDDTISSDDMTWSSNKIKASLNGLDLSNMIQAVAGRATLQSASMTQIGNLLIVNASVKIATALTAYQTGVIQFADAKYKPKKTTYAIALKNSTPFICGINASTGEITCNHGGCAVNDILYFDFMYMM